MAAVNRSHRLRLAAWLGPLVALVGLVSYYTLAVRVPFLRDTAIANLALVALGLGLSLWALWTRRGFWRIAGAALSLLCAALLFGYVFVLSSTLPGTAGVLAVGEPAPGFTLPDQGDRPVSLDDFTGTSVILVFYRGFW